MTWKKSTKYYKYIGLLAAMLKKKKTKNYQVAQDKNGR
jgi:hypothetical protein